MLEEKSVFPGISSCQNSMPPPALLAYFLSDFVDPGVAGPRSRQRLLRRLHPAALRTRPGHHRHGLLWAATARGSWPVATGQAVAPHCFRYIKARAAYVSDVHYSDQSGASHDLQVPETPARHDFGCVTNACCGPDDGRAGSHQLVDPYVVRVLPVRDQVRNVNLGDDADLLAGLCLRDDEGARACSLHQVGGPAT